MANIEDCPGFETFGADVKAARKAKRLSRKTMAEIINVDARYLANIENDGTIPSLPVVIQLIKECGLPVERYFNPEIMREESAQRQRMRSALFWLLRMMGTTGGGAAASAVGAASGCTVRAGASSRKISGAG